MLVRSRGGSPSCARYRPAREDSRTGGTSWSVPTASLASRMYDRLLIELSAQLKRKLKGGKSGLDRDGSGSPSSSHTYSPSQQHAARSSPLSPSAANGAGLSDYNPRTNATTSPISLPHVSLGLSPMSVDRLINDDNNVMNIHRSARSDSLKSLIHLGWNPELPEPATLER